MSSSLLPQQCPACLIRLVWIVMPLNKEIKERNQANGEEYVNLQSSQESYASKFLTNLIT